MPEDLSFAFVHLINVVLINKLMDLVAPLFIPNLLPSEFEHLEDVPCFLVSMQGIVAAFLLDMVQVQPDALAVRYLPDEIQGLLEEQFPVLLLQGRNVVDHHSHCRSVLQGQSVRFLVEDH